MEFLCKTMQTRSHITQTWADIGTDLLLAVTPEMVP